MEALCAISKLKFKQPISKLFLHNKKGIELSFNPF